jgi:hypothetical protein
MVRASILVAVTLSSATAAADRWTTSCEAGMENARLVYQGSVEDTARQDFAAWQWSRGKDAVRLHYSWRRYDYHLAVASTLEKDHAWRARWDHGEWWFERVDRGHLASIRASGSDAIRDRSQLLRAVQPALDACLKKR